MVLIAMACHDTVENERSKYTQETLLSLYDTVDWSKHRIMLIDNNSCATTKKILAGFRKSTPNVTVLTLSANIGTAGAINRAIALRDEGEVVCKMDNDVVVHQSGWLDELEQRLSERPDIGILGLRRDDVYGEFKEDGVFLYSDDIIGTCTALNPLLLDKVGYYQQFSTYGYDDSLLSCRSLAAGFKNAFLPHIKITHLDDGLNPYCDWKKREASVYLQQASIHMDMIRTGKLSYYYDGN